MKTKILVVAVLLIFVHQAAGGTLGISDVNVLPNQPSSSDIITINVSGWSANITSSVALGGFSQNGLFLQMDLRVDVGLLTIPGSWAYSTEIQPLSPGTYTLEVRAFDYDYAFPWHNRLEDTYTVDFTVIPEPTTFLLLVLGAAGNRLIRQKHRSVSVR